MFSVSRTKGILQKQSCLCFTDEAVVYIIVIQTFNDIELVCGKLL